ncbi:hypothetical protein GJR96_14715 [Haloferax sp. MBLA0076]|uniref:Uncharacterized protein n=1 Tax=Haloferax litoreum TaxID=2666140 RepID=A0A6A8GJ51_9EURY|nr:MULTISPECIES: hypothetical protein [Haloferax]KAB1194626.1 hypothetical protein Hfx1148_14645 [Haloferax sp. CBA1148]MRX23203.1 hypothetical protein [Haloferax litoreum]
MAEKPFQSQLIKAEQELSEVFAEGHLVGFRDDVKEIWEENRENMSWDINSRELALEVDSSIQNSQEKILTVEDGIDKLQIIDGLTGGALGSGLYLILTHFGVASVPAFIPSIAVFLFFTLINHGLLFTKALINLACFSSASPRERDSALLFKRGWNAKVLSSNSSILGIIVVALARRVWRGGYERGLDKIQHWDLKNNILERDTGFFELI